MKILVIVERSPRHRFLVSLEDKRLVGEVKTLVDRKKYAQAIVRALTLGTFEREVLTEDLPALTANLILSEKSAHWDLSR